MPSWLVLLQGRPELPRGLMRKEAGSAPEPLSLGTVQVRADLLGIWVGVGCCGTLSGLAWKEDIVVGPPSVFRLLRPNCSETGLRPRTFHGRG